VSTNISSKALDVYESKWWQVSMQQVRGVQRVDAEHFQPKYQKLVAHLKEGGSVRTLGEIATYIERGVQPRYVEDGEIIVVNSRHLGEQLLNVDATERTDRDFWTRNKRARLHKYDVLVYSTGAYIGRTNAWLEEQDAVASNHVTIIRTNDSCHPLYLATFLNAPPGLMQAEQWASGSGQRELYPEDIARFLIYLPSDKFQREVGELMEKSHEAYQHARRLAHKATSKVVTFMAGG